MSKKVAEATALSAVSSQQVSLWEEVQKQAGEVEKAWAKVVEAKRQGRDQAPDRLKDAWTIDIETAEDKQNTWGSLILLYEAQQKAAVATLAQYKAKEAPFLESLPLWEEAIMKAAETEKAWAQVAEAKRRGLEYAPERLKGSWIKGLGAAV